jgi:glucose/arabinose dehydrogenase
VLASDSTLYVSTRGNVLRYRFSGAELQPRERVDTIVVGLPYREKPAHTLALDSSARLLVNVGAISDACQAKDGPGIQGRNPCPELEMSAGIWRFATDGSRQTLASGSHVASGLYNAIALAVNPRDTMIYAVSHARDHLHEYWPGAIDDLAGATRVAEEMIRVSSVRAEYGWPYCYFDMIDQRRVVAPEYAGDPDMQRRCDRMIRPLHPFPAHWAPMALVFYTDSAFPAKYREGAFVAFHGSAHRSPLPQEGYQISFLPFRDGIPRATAEDFATGFAGGITSPEGARHRVSGMAQGRDGALYVSDDRGGRIWRIVYRR